jgi:hypothetical protein
MNRPSVSNFIGLLYQTASVNQWFVGLRETGTNNYIIYNEQTATDVLTIDRVNNSAAFSTDVTLNNGTLFVSGGSGQAYSSRLSTAYIFPYITTYLDSFAGAGWEGRLQFRTNSAGGAMNTH